MKKIILIICLFIFNITTLNSNSSKELLYDNKLSYDEKNSIYFVNTNSKELSKILKYSNIKILSYIIDDKKYYSRSISKLEDIYTKEMNISEKIYYENYGIKIDGINVMSNTYELKYIDSLLDIY